MSTTTGIPEATSSSQPSATSGLSSGGSTSGPSSPLLFFVALGFGVVFTNLWIIVGVKYCFRYNQRNRARLAGEDPDGVDLNAMPRQRRRREKKLMSMDEVNEKFPLVKYKTWRSTRAEKGLPTAGGITNMGSRPVSVRHMERDSSDGIEKEPKTPTTFTISEKIEHGRPEQVSDSTPAIATGSAGHSDTAKTIFVSPPEPAVVRRASNDEDTDAADRIQIAIPPEQLPDPGDTCAICIDTIEDDDDIRGLSCGHAFHASCVDPWLTSRRACCPLCKADYYVPKPRPEGAQDDVRGSSRVEQIQIPHGPFAIMSTPRRGNRRDRERAFNLPGVFLGSPQPFSSRSSQGLQVQPDVPGTAPEVQTVEPNAPSWRQRLPNVRLPAVPALSRIRRGRGNDTGEQPAETPSPTPAQLEAGRA